MPVLIGVGVVLVVLFALAIGYDLYWRRRGFRTEVQGRGRKLTKVHIPLKPDSGPGATDDEAP